MPTRLNLFIGASVLIALAVAGISARAWFAKPAKPARKDFPQQSASCCSPKPQAAGTPVPVAVPTFIAPGMRVALESVSANRDRGRLVITCATVNQGQEKLDFLEVMLLAFTPEKTLSRVEGRTIRLGINAGAKRSASFTTEMSHDPTHTLTFAVKGLTGETKKQEVEMQQLVEELAKNKATGANPQVNVKEKTKNRDTFVPNICYESFRLANTLARNSGGKFAVGGSACDQYRHAFSLSFFPVMQK
jgi:hypothetical protein